MTGIPKPVRYTVVSGFCFLLTVFLIPALIYLRINYIISTSIVFTINVIIGFVFHTYWTHEEKFSILSFFKYIFAIGFNLPLTIVLTTFAHDVVGVSIYIATTFSSVVLYAWNYLATRWAVVRPVLGVKP